MDAAIDVTACQTVMGHAADAGNDLDRRPTRERQVARLITMGGLTAEFFTATPELHHQLFECGVMPPVTKELIAALRTRA